VQCDQVDAKLAYNYSRVTESPPFQECTPLAKHARRAGDSIPLARLLAIDGGLLCVVICLLQVLQCEITIQYCQEWIDAIYPRGKPVIIGA
jgi:hypothetical protein